MATQTSKRGSAVLESLRGKKTAPDKTPEPTVSETAPVEEVTVTAETVTIVAGSVEVTNEPTETTEDTTETVTGGETEAKPEDSSPTSVAASEDFDWDTLPAAEVQIYSRAVVRQDLEASTPAFIKARVADAFKATEAKGLDPQGRPIPVTVVQFCGSAERASEFLKLARKYATFKDWTLRGMDNPAKIAVGEGKFKPGTGHVSFSVKPRETRIKPKAADTSALEVPATPPAETPADASAEAKAE